MDCRRIRPSGLMFCFCSYGNNASVLEAPRESIHPADSFLLHSTLRRAAEATYLWPFKQFFGRLDRDTNGIVAQVGFSNRIAKKANRAAFEAELRRQMTAFAFNKRLFQLH